MTESPGSECLSAAQETWTIKRGIPAGIFAALLVDIVLCCIHQSGPFGKIAHSLLPWLGVISGWVLFQSLGTRRVLDEVRLDANVLLVRNHGRELRMPLYDIQKVHASTIGSRSARVTLTLRHDTIFGNKWVFIPAARHFHDPRRAEAMAYGLSERMDAVRGARA